MRKYMFNSSWAAFLSLYWLLFFVTLGSFLKLSDEYEGGNKMAEFAANLFGYVLGFPMNIVMFISDLFAIQYPDNGFIVIMVVLCMIINCLVVTTLLNFFYMKLVLSIKKDV